MNIEPNHSAEGRQFRERYRNLADDDLVRLAMDQNLIPPARGAITDELEARGLRDLTSFKKRFEEDAAIARAAGVSLIVPSSELPMDTRDSRYFGIAGLVIIALIGVHKWILGDVTTWRKEGTLFLWLSFALLFTWDPINKVIRGQASAKLMCWLTLGLLYITVTASALAVPAVGRVAASLNPVVALAIIASPAIVYEVVKAARRFASRSL